MSAVNPSPPERDRYGWTLTSGIVDKVRPVEGGWDIRYRDDIGAVGFILSRDRVPDWVDPRPGQRLTLHCRLVSQVVGVDLDGVELYLQTPEQVEADHQAARDKMRRDADERYEAKRDGLWARVDVLPAQLAERIRRFDRKADRFGPDYLAYELFVCEQAALLSGMDTAEITAFSLADPDEQRELVSGWASQDMTGNQHGAIITLARAMAEEPRAVPFVHAAIAPLVGCDAVGCHPLDDDERDLVASIAGGEAQ